MAVPRVFVSSTCYDLRDIRQSLKQFITSLGYDAVLSEEGDIFYSDDRPVEASCLNEVPNCQMMVLIIGGRFGTAYQGTTESITNHEFKYAVEHKVPIFALVLQDVLTSHRLFEENLKNKDVDAHKIAFPSVDDTRIFNFIDEVGERAKGNALQGFSHYADIQSYLTKQWAGMMYEFLRGRNEYERVADTLNELRRMNQLIETTNKAILEKVGRPDSYPMLVFNLLRKAIAYNDFTNEYAEIFYSGPNVVLDVIRMDSWCEFVQKQGLVVLIDDDKKEWRIYMSGDTANCLEFEESSWGWVNREYEQLRKELLDILGQTGYKAEQFIKDVEAP